MIALPWQSLLFLDPLLTAIALIVVMGLAFSIGGYFFGASLRPFQARASTAIHQRDRTVLKLGEARGRQDILDEVRMLEHGQLKAHVLAVQHCLDRARTTNSAEERKQLLDTGLLQTQRLMAVVVGLHQSVSSSALPDDLEQTVTDVVRNLAGAYPESACRVEVVGYRGPSLPETVRRALILVLYNAVHNAFAHACPSEVIVQLRYAPDALILTISDNGCGMMADVRKRSGRGLRDMQLLTEAQGGALHISSVCGQGTQITAAFPLAATYTG